MKRYIPSIGLLTALTLVGCMPQTERTQPTQAEMLQNAKTPEEKANIQKSIDNNNIAEKVRETHMLPNGKPIPGYKGRN